MVIPFAFSAQAELERIILDSGEVVVEITPNIGGRLLSAHLRGQPNFLKVGELVNTNANPEVTPQSPHIGYLAHEVWVGPQSEWWTHQLVNDTRRAQKSVWPPDPYLVLARNKLVEASGRQVVLQSGSSPVSGVSLKKTFRLVDGKPNQIALGVEVENTRDTKVAWDIWYNTRVPHTTHVYVPVSDASAVRIEHFADGIYDGLESQFIDGFFSLSHSNSTKKQGRKGKVFIQPAYGWLVAFRDHQVLIIQFALQPRGLIHPEQGQVELYQEFLGKQPEAGLLELEVHAPYKTLMPGETMNATELWTLLPYSGAATPEAHLKYLRQLGSRGVLPF